MLIYFVTPLLLYFLSFVNFKNKHIKNFFIILLGIFLCSSYFTGTDWRQYEPMYNNANFNSLSLFYAEKGFYLWMCLFKFFKLNFYIFFIITKAFCFYMFYKKINSYNINSYQIFLFMLAPILLYLFIDCPLRQLIAIALILNLDVYANKKQYLKFFIFLILAFSFHKSAIICLIFLFFNKIHKVKKEILISILLLVFLILTNQNMILKIISLLPNVISVRATHYMGTQYFTTKSFSLGNIEKILIVFTVIFKKDYIIKKYDFGKILISGIVVYFLSYRTGLTINILGRLVYYFYIYYILGVVIFINLFKNKIIKLSIYTVFMFYHLILINKLVFNDFRYIPYTSYIPYIFQEKPSYEYRSNFNKIEFKKRFNKN